MDNPFPAGHRQLIDAQAGGLSQAWQRAAAEAARPRATAETASAPKALHRRPWLGGVAVAATFGVALLWMLRAGDMGAGEHVAPVAAAAPIALASTDAVPAADADAAAVPRR